MRKEEAENLFLNATNPKISQRLRFLRLDKDFERKSAILRKKWGFLVKEFKFNYEKFESLLSVKFINNKIKISPLSEKQKNTAGLLGKKMEKIILNDRFEKDIIKLTTEAKLYPIEYWKNVVLAHVLTKNFFPVTHFLKLGLENYIPRNELLKVPQKLNFALKIIKNKKTKEVELFIQIFENTSLKDLKDNWKLVYDTQKKLKEIKGITKRYYPLKNIEFAEKILNRKKKEIKYYEPTTDKWEKEKEKDSTIAEEILEEIPLEDIEKVKNKLKQTRYQYRKRLNS